MFGKSAPHSLNGCTNCEIIPWSAKPQALAFWAAPEGLSVKVHTLDARPGGKLRLSFAREAPAKPMTGRPGVTADALTVRFVELKAYERIVQVVMLETYEPGFAGEMELTVLFEKVTGGTQLTLTCDNMPAGLRPQDSEAVCQAALKKLIRLVE